MCGIAGIVDLRRESTEGELTDGARSMAAALRHRGPDDEGRFIDAANGIALAHRRLSIIDLSPEGHQPMISLDGRFVLSYNGEVYNFEDIRTDLGFRNWRGHSDTEVVVEAIAAWGIENTVRRLNGMFAIAVWDRRDGRLTLVRDRLGKKPLYYGSVGSRFLFGSELTAITAHPDWRGEIDRAALRLYLRHGYIRAPYSIYAGIRKLEPGCMLRIELPADSIDARPRRYWQLRTEPEMIDLGEAVESLSKLVDDAVSIRMVSDVPLGAFLSGGVDSSVVVESMQRQAGRPIRTFTIGFEEKQWDESEYAESVAAFLGTDHTTLKVNARTALELIPDLASIFDEPFADSSQIPTAILSRLTRDHVTVALSGDGGDELFSGYERYRIISDDWRKIGWIPHALRHGMSRMIPDVGRLGRVRYLADSPDLQSFYLRRIVQWPVGDEPLDDDITVESWERETVSMTRNLDHRTAMAFLDVHSYLPDDIMVKVDRASMAYSLECRAPLLDYRLAEFAFSLESNLKVRSNVSKYLLRQVLHRRIPEAMFARPKRGFSVPVRPWLRGPLRQWAGDLLDGLKKRHLVRPSVIDQLWGLHQEETADKSVQLWTLLMLEAWLSRSTPSERSCP